MVDYLRIQERISYMLATGPSLLSTDPHSLTLGGDPNLIRMSFVLPCRCCPRWDYQQRLVYCVTLCALP